jgi:hypothetical protein
MEPTCLNRSQPGDFAVSPAWRIAGRQEPHGLSGHPLSRSEPARFATTRRPTKQLPVRSGRDGWSEKASRRTESASRMNAAACRLLPSAHASHRPGNPLGQFFRTDLRCTLDHFGAGKPYGSGNLDRYRLLRGWIRRHARMLLRNARRRGKKIKSNRSRNAHAPLTLQWWICDAQLPVDPL